MTLSFWRCSHLVLTLFSSVFLTIASITGTILAIYSIQEKTSINRVKNFETILLEETLPTLRKTYPEITELSVDHNQFVILQGIDQNGNYVNANIDPRTGKILGKPSVKSEFIQWNIAFHRSLFLGETGRFFVGLNSFFFGIDFYIGSFYGTQQAKKFSQFIF